ncbi:type IV pilin [Natrinema halophilum]|uniref:Type IV pilin N-terminal domain-containing protein n=1 Tax=Natrinema halophilum TaxID=1699371 RepID=A0A7D5KT21_9EURY|nr:type IV pilin N-terminal domain-containing protein [Natrinema halophilum]QLG50044.1 type IV pilin N-terminal domain-containing protein [Natrinema halophilum]
MDLKFIRPKLVGDDNERAVSPVIGVILMVAITVILAAVIAAFVMDMGSNQSAPAQAGLDISNNTQNTTSPGGYNVTVTSMGDNTKTVKCSSKPSEKATSVGGKFKCPDGSSIIGVNDEDKETVLQSDL